MLKQIALELDDQELYKLACELEKEATIIDSFNNVRSGLASAAEGTVLNKNVGEAVTNGLRGMVKPLKAAIPQATPFTHMLKDGTKITAAQFGRLGESAKAYAKVIR